MTERRPLGTGPDPADASRTPDAAPPRAQLAAERLAVAPATEPTRPPGTGRRVLGAGPTAPGPIPR
ncbi:hypothetical protein [Streptomyces sp. NPDC046939]|uniref:hypothetical protein n=1 Tax=Streptomyces sp. NPDC046939 TaxID=3155376 RepID=UPI0033CFB05B